MKHNLILLCTFSILAGGEFERTDVDSSRLTTEKLAELDSARQSDHNDFCSDSLPVPSAPPASLATSTDNSIANLAKELEIASQLG